MKKEELVAYLTFRSWRRYGQTFDIAFLHDLIKQALMPKAKPLGHNGRRTIYGYDWKAYRRGLQIVRLRRAGLTGFDAIRVQLFRCGYSLPAHEVQRALWNEYRLCATKLNTNVRSRYADNVREVPAGHQASMITSFGDLDPDFDAAGLRMAPQTYVEGYRAAKAGALGSIDEVAATNSVFQIIARRLSFAALAQSLASRLVEGLLMVDPPAMGERGSARDYVERLILGASPASLTSARETSAAMCIGARRLSEIMGAFGLQAGFEKVHKASAKVAGAARQREWGAFYLVLALREVERDRFQLTPQKMLSLIEQIKTKEFKLTSFFAKLWRLQRR